MTSLPPSIVIVPWLRCTSQWYTKGIACSKTCFDHFTALFSVLHKKTCDQQMQSSRKAVALQNNRATTTHDKNAVHGIHFVFVYILFAIHSYFLTKIYLNITEENSISTREKMVVVKHRWLCYCGFTLRVQKEIVSVNQCDRYVNQEVLYVLPHFPHDFVDYT